MTARKYLTSACLLLFASAATIATGIDDEHPENVHDNCRISDADALRSPWLGYLRVSNGRPGDEMDAYWSVAVIHPQIVLTAARVFRSPFCARKLQLRPAENYTVVLKDGVRREVMFIHINSNVTVYAEHWMVSDSDFALIYLEKPIEFSAAVRPLCLPSWNITTQNEVVEEFEEFLEEDELVFASGWKCNYYFALRPEDALFPFKVANYSYCSQVWESQADYSIEAGTKYQNRVCETDATQDDVRTTTSTEQDSIASALCIEKFYFGLRTQAGDDRILFGISNGIARQVYPGPTAYALVLKPDFLDWIEASIKCGPEQFTCDNGDCLTKLSYVCDGDEHCKDGADENPVFCKARTTVDEPPDCPVAMEADQPVRGSDKQSVYFYVGLGILGGAVLIVGATVTTSAYMVRKSKAKTELTDAEISEFRNGIMNGGFWGDENYEFIGVGGSSVSSSWSSGFSCHGGENELQFNSMQMPFIYELERTEIEFREEIGAGAFGIVHKRVVGGKTVPIKVLKRGVVNKELFKTHLVELKIMAFVNFIKGGHKNVVKLIGANTENIRNFELFIVVEYCQNGSVADYLDGNRSRFQSTYKLQAQGGQRSLLPLRYVPANSFQSVQSPFCLQSLHNWALQIVDGMHFLASHNIIHGDLAARNILLDHNLVAKISDFGLSRQIYYNGSSCAKVVKKSTLLPRRWMAPEVIGCSQISAKSDVWSFGVTLWELYTLGATPYGGLEWNSHFVQQLKFGLRLPRPEYANEPLYQLIQSCWTYDPEQRPDVGALRILLNSFWGELDYNLFAYE